MQKDPRTGGFFISDSALKKLAQAGQEKNDPVAGIVVSAFVLSWGTCLRAKEWYRDACCKKYFVLRNQLEQHLNMLRLREGK